MPFKPGNNANPKGGSLALTKKQQNAFLRGIRKLGPAALEKLEELMDAENEAVRLKAVTLVIERAYGTTPKSLVGFDIDGRLKEIGATELPTTTNNTVNIVENLRDPGLRKDLKAAVERHRERKAKPTVVDAKVEPE